MGAFLCSGYAHASSVRNRSLFWMSSDASISFFTAIRSAKGKLECSSTATLARFSSETASSTLLAFAMKVARFLVMIGESCAKMSIV